MAARTPRNPIAVGRLAAPLVLAALATGLGGPLAGCRFDVTLGDVEPRANRVMVRLAGIDRADILFVVDNSASMGDKQRRFADALRDAEPLLHALGSVHVAMVTTDLGAGTLDEWGCHGRGDGATLRIRGSGAGADCPSVMRVAAATDDWLDLDFNAGTSNVAGGRIGDALGCLIRAGTHGCAFEQPLEAARSALARSRAAQDGFLRDDALLLVVFVTDEDDCSVAGAGSLFDPSATMLWGPMSSFRCARAGIRWGLPTMPLPGAPTGGPLPMPSPDRLSTSLSPLQRYLDFFGSGGEGIAAGIKADPGDVVLASFSGAREPIEIISVTPSMEPGAEQPPCDGPLDGMTCQPSLRHACVASADRSLFAAPAPRLGAVIEGAVHHYAAPLCEPDHRQALADLIGLVRSLESSSGCLATPLRDPANPECEVVDTLVIDGKTSTAAILSCRTTGNATPCWRVLSDESCASVTDPRTTLKATLRLRISRGDATTPPGTITSAHCATP